MARALGKLSAGRAGRGRSTTPSRCRPTSTTSTRASRAADDAREVAPERVLPLGGDLRDASASGSSRASGSAPGGPTTLPEPGAVRVLELLGESILVARTREGQLVAHYNVCRHRGARLCATDERRRQPPPGRATIGGRIRCPYHSWTYALDGKLLGAPFLNQDPSLRRGGFLALPGRRSRALGRLLLPQPLAGRAARARASPAALGAVPERVRPLSPRVGCATARRIIYDVARQLEGRRRELQRVLPLRGRPSRALRGRAGLQEGGGAGLDWEHGIPHRDGAFTFTRSAPRPRALRRPLGGGEGPAQGRARLSEPLPLALARPRRRVPPDCPRRPTGRGSSATSCSIRRRWRSPASIRPTPSSSGTSSTARTGRSAKRSSAACLRASTVRLLRADGGREPGHPAVRPRAAGRDSYSRLDPLLLTCRSSRYAKNGLQFSRMN